VQQDDVASLLGIANDPVTRSSSRRSSRITADEHVAWFGKALERSGATFWVAEVDGLVVGHARLEDLGEAWELSYGLDPVVRGSGWSRSMVDEAIRRVRALRRLPIVAVTRQSNVSSKRILETVGFHLDSSGGRAQELGAEVPTGFVAYIFEC
jgi:RimJ/RimL family protein N-acetyltransferase